MALAPLPTLTRCACTWWLLKGLTNSFSALARLSVSCVRPRKRNPTGSICRVVLHRTVKYWYKGPPSRDRVLSSKCASDAMIRQCRSAHPSSRGERSSAESKAAGRDANHSEVCDGILLDGKGSGRAERDTTWPHGRQGFSSPKWHGTRKDERCDQIHRTVTYLGTLTSRSCNRVARGRSATGEALHSHVGSERIRACTPIRKLQACRSGVWRPQAASRAA